MTFKDLAYWYISIVLLYVALSTPSPHNKLTIEVYTHYTNVRENGIVIAILTDSTFDNSNCDTVLSNSNGHNCFIKIDEYTSIDSILEYLIH